MCGGRQGRHALGALERQQARRPDRIAAGGGSAGGYLAAAVATLPGHDDPGGDKSVSVFPNALALFNPGTIISPVLGYTAVDDRQDEYRARFDADPHSVSPYHHVGENPPPTIIFHAKADTTVPYESADLFCAKLREKGGKCRLEGYEGMPHGFFNHGRNDNVPYRDTVRKMDEFFVKLGWLDGKPTIQPTE